MEETILEPGRAQERYWQDLWAHRELLAILAWRDVAVRYKQTVVGIAWAVLQPLAQMLVMVAVFGLLARLPSEGNAPYALLVFAALLPWQFFAAAVTASSASIVGNASLVSKTYFPRLVIPLAAIATSLVDLLVAFAILAALLLLYGHPPTWRLLALPAFVALAVLAAAGPGLLVAALNAQYRDFRFIVPFAVQFGLFVSPVGFSAAAVRERFGDGLYLLYSLNPMVGVIDGFRWSILGTQARPDATAIALSATLSVALLVLGVRRFRRVERSLADVI